MKKIIFIFLMIFFQIEIFGINTFSLTDWENEVYLKSLRHKNQSQNELAINELRKIPDLRNNYDAWILYIQLLFLNEKYEKVVEETKNINKYFLQKGIDDIFYGIIFSYTKLHKFNELQSIITKIGAKKVKNSVGFLLVNYLQEKQYDKYYEVINNLQDIIFDKSEKLLLNSIYSYYTKDYKNAKTGFGKLKNNHNNIGEISLYYLSLIQFETNTNLLDFDYQFSKPVIENQIIYEVKNDNFTDLKSLKNFNYILYKNLLSYKYFRENKFKESFNNLEYEDNPFYYYLLAESERKIKDYKLAIKHYKILRKMKFSQKDYLNYSIGNCYYHLYKYNNSAYYWMKLLYSKEDKYQFYGLLKLSKLYSFTKHYNYAIPYYQSMLSKYSYSNKPYLRAFFKIILKEKRTDLLINYYKKYNSFINKKLKIEILLYLGKYYDENNNVEKAIENYSKYLSLKKDDEIEFRVNYLKYTSNNSILYENFLLNFILNHPNNKLNEKLSLDLIKFYLKKKEYDEAGNIIGQLDSSLVVIKKDSLNYFKAIIYSGQKKWRKSADLIYEFVKKDSVYNDKYELYEFTISKMKAKKAIQYLNSKLDSTNNYFLRKREIINLAEIYDKNNLYREAIINYSLLLADSTLNISSKEKYLINIKIATDFIILKKYEKAINILEKIISEEKRTSEIDYLMYIAYSALGNSQKEKEYLLDYFLNFPNGTEFNKVALILSKKYYENDQLLLSWIIYKELKKKKIENLKELQEFKKLEKAVSKIEKDSLEYYQIQPLKNAFFWKIDKDKE